MDSWDRTKTRDDAGMDDEEEEEEDIVYDDDEDEFGLPTIASMRRKQAQSVTTKQPKTVGSGGGGLGKLDTTSLGVGLGSNRQRADSSDIAEERGLPMYPTARKGEGKILRPQYKDILRGTSPRSRTPRRKKLISPKTLQMRYISSTTAHPPRTRPPRRWISIQVAYQGSTSSSVSCKQARFRWPSCGIWRGLVSRTRYEP